MSRTIAEQTYVQQGRDVLGVLHAIHQHGRFQANEQDYESKSLAIALGIGLVDVARERSTRVPTYVLTAAGRTYMDQLSPRTAEENDR